ncbi:MAG: FAD/NAD(P)-binding protein [Pseudomonadota bacterium]
MQINPYLPHEAEIVERIQESDAVFTLRLRFVEAEMRSRYSFWPGQFNMVYLYGAGEVPISIVSDPEDERLLDHTIRAVGRVTDGLARLKPGDRVGIRGPYGRGWPLKEAAGRDVVVVTGGLGCAPAVSAVNYIIKRRAEYGRLVIIQGVKKSKELIYRARYDAWARVPNTHVMLAADSGDVFWPGHVGLVTDLFERVEFDQGNVLAMMCGPEGMMVTAAKALAQRGVAEEGIFLSMERNMHCAVGLCGHCQFGGQFICKDGPVFRYPDVKGLLGIRGF